MNIKEFIQSEKNETIHCMKEDIKEGFMKEEELNEEFIQTLNEEIQTIVFKNVAENNRFNLYKEDGSFYYTSMLGKGENIPYDDLREIIQRLYVYHHESQKFKFEIIDNDYSMELNYETIQNYNNNIARMVVDSIGNDWFLNTSDFK
jgi:hypothetical protein